MPTVYSRLIPLLNQKETRDMKRYSQKEIAEAIGVSPATVSRWMKGTENFNLVTAGTAARLAEWLDCDIGDLLTIRRPETFPSEKAS